MSISFLTPFKYILSFGLSTNIALVAVCERWYVDILTKKKLDCFRPLVVVAETVLLKRREA